MRDGVILLNDLKVVQDPIQKSPCVSSCQQKPWEGLVCEVCLAWEYSTREQVLISAVSSWEPGRLEPNPKMNAFITEQQTWKPLGSCHLSTVNRMDGRHKHGYVSRAAARWWTPVCVQGNGCTHKMYAQTQSVLSSQTFSVYSGNCCSTNTAEFTQMTNVLAGKQKQSLIVWVLGGWGIY